MTRARKTPHPTTAIAAGAGARAGGGIHWLPRMVVDADPFGANLSRSGISR